MKTIKLKTNINCGGCLASITPTFSKWEEVKSWKVDIANPDKVLTVETESLEGQQIIDKLASIGYKAQAM